MIKLINEWIKQIEGMCLEVNVEKNKRLVVNEKDPTNRTQISCNENKMEV